MALNSSITISGTDPSNPKSAGEIVDRLLKLRGYLVAMDYEIGRLEMYAGGVRDVLHFDQSYPRKRADMIGHDVTSTIRMLREDVERLADQVKRASDKVADSGVNLKARFTWRPVSR